jgi:crossover junction endodeoxyribonuclease RusA
MKIEDPARVTIHGTPIATFTFIGLPSVNTHYGLHFRPKAVRTAEWRYEAREKALALIQNRGWEEGPLIKHRALVVVNVYPPYEEISDTHNVYVKALLDGFTDAGIWVDDEWAWVPLVLFAFGGLGTGPKTERMTLIEIYELKEFHYRGIRQILPKGRTRLDGDNKQTVKSGK